MSLTVAQTRLKSYAQPLYHLDKKMMKKKTSIDIIFTEQVLTLSPKMDSVNGNHPSASYMTIQSLMEVAHNAVLLCPISSCSKLSLMLQAASSAALNFTRNHRITVSLVLSIAEDVTVTCIASNVYLTMSSTIQI